MFLTILAHDYPSSEIREIFALFDKNNDGLVHTSELGTIIRALNLNPTEQEIMDLMGRVDPTKSGQFSQAQLEQLVKERGKDPETLEDLVSALAVFDGDRDGRLSVEEFKFAMMSMGEKMQEHEIEEIITDSDLVSNNQIIIESFARLIMNRV